jgi:hypothetical protein
MRLDQALITDLRQAWRSRSIRLYLALQLAAGVLWVSRRGSDTISTVVLIWLGMLVLAFMAWWAGRHPRAHPEPDPLPNAGPRAIFALVTVLGMAVWGFRLSVAVGLVLVACGIGGWLWSAWRTGGNGSLRERLTRDPRPFVPMLLLIAVPRLLLSGPAYLLGATMALPSGIGQQLLYLLGLYAPLEAVSRHAATAAVVSALLFALLHIPLVLDANHDDLLAAIGNVVLFQSSVGLIACLAYQRHRAVVPIGVAHALAIG